MVTEFRGTGSIASIENISLMCKLGGDGIFHVDLERLKEQIARQMGHKSVGPRLEPFCRKLSARYW